MAAKSSGIRTFTTYLKLFHPFLPFVTEKLWGELGCDGMLIFVTRAKPEAVAKTRQDAEAQRATVAALEERLAG